MAAVELDRIDAEQVERHPPRPRRVDDALLPAEDRRSLDVRQRVHGPGLEPRRRGLRSQPGDGPRRVGGAAVVVEAADRLWRIGPVRRLRRPAGACCRRSRPRTRSRPRSGRWRYRRGGGRESRETRGETPDDAAPRVGSSTRRASGRRGSRRPPRPPVRRRRARPAASARLRGLPPTGRRRPLGGRAPRAPGRVSPSTTHRARSRARGRTGPSGHSSPGGNEPATLGGAAKPPPSGAAPSWEGIKRRESAHADFRFA